MDTDPTDQEDKDTADDWQAKKPKWSDDRTAGPTENKYDRSQWVEWNKKDADATEVTYTNVWEEPSVEKETKWDAWGTSPQYRPDWTAAAEVKKDGGDGIPPTDPAGTPADPLSQWTPGASSWQVGTPASSAWGETSTRGADTDMSAGEEADKWRAFTKADARQKYKTNRTSNWGKAKGGKGYDKSKSKDYKGKSAW